MRRATLGLGRWSRRSYADRRHEYRRFVRNATHELVGVSLAVAAGRVLEAGPLEMAGLAAAALFGSRLPDVDQLGALCTDERGSNAGGQPASLARCCAFRWCCSRWSCRTGR